MAAPPAATCRHCDESRLCNTHSRPSTLPTWPCWPAPLGQLYDCAIAAVCRPCFLFSTQARCKCCSVRLSLEFVCIDQLSTLAYITFCRFELRRFARRSRRRKRGTNGRLDKPSRNDVVGENRRSSHVVFRRLRHRSDPIPRHVQR